MLTKLTIRNFKRFTSAEIELGNPVVFIGPNNSGKTTALQAIALWEVGMRSVGKTPSATLNRKDVFGLPVPRACLGPVCCGRICGRYSRSRLPSTA